MILVKPSAEIIAISQFPLSLIEQAGRVCYKSEDKITPESAKPFAEMILKRGHESVIEHASATVKIVCDRGVSHELVRHSLASFSQESTRYCDYNNGHVTFVIPSWVNLGIGCFTYAEEYEMCQEDTEFAISPEHNWMRSMLNTEQSYKNLRKEGWKPEQARSVLPNSLKTEIVVTANLREWRHIFKLRTSKAAHPQMREIMIPLLKKFQEYIPVIFMDISKIVEAEWFNTVCNICPKCGYKKTEYVKRFTPLSKIKQKKGC